LWGGSAVVAHAVFSIFRGGDHVKPELRLRHCELEGSVFHLRYRSNNATNLVAQESTLRPEVETFFPQESLRNSATDARMVHDGPRVTMKIPEKARCLLNIKTNNSICLGILQKNVLQFTSFGGLVLRK
jgi:hypothetical protein